MAKHDLILKLSPTPATATVDKDLPTVAKSDSLINWLLAYGEAEVAGSPAATVEAKRRDLQLFLNYFSETLRSDHVDDWSKSISKGFVAYLEKRGDSAGTVNRRLATLRHVCRWIHDRRPFLTGDPFEGVRDLETEQPTALGLTTLQQNRLRAAADKLLALKNRKNQQPRRDFAVFIVLLRTALRVSELVNLDLEQYDGKYFLQVKRKGRQRTPKVYLAAEAREALDVYIEQERGRQPGPLITTRTGGRITRQAIDTILRELARVANVNLPPAEHIRLHAHLLRHTALKEIVKKGRHYAQKMSGNAGLRHIERYLSPLDSDYEAAVEETDTI